MADFDPRTTSYFTPKVLLAAFHKVMDADERRGQRFREMIISSVFCPHDGHVCGPMCVCPDHPDLPLLYGAKPHPEHACQRPDCRYAHGMKGV